MKRATQGHRLATVALALVLLPRAALSGLAGEADRESIRASGGCDAASPLPPGESGAFSLKVGDLERQYRLHLPRDYDSSRPVSLVLDFHGYTGTAEDEERSTTRFSPHADAHGYAIVFPQGTSFVAPDGDAVTSWNDLAGNASPGPEGSICTPNAFEYPFPPECGEPKPCTWNTCHDDLAFVSALLDTLEETLCLDLDRIYATGMSNGGMFVHRLGCAMPERFAAIAPVSGTLARGFNCAPDGSTPLSLINIYGSRDRYVDLTGSVSSDGYYYTSAEEVMRKWASPESQDCAASPTPFPTSQDGTLDLQCIQFADCATGAEIVNCTWNGGHDWPKDGDHDFGNQIIWEFFARHTRAGFRSPSHDH